MAINLNSLSDRFLISVLFSLFSRVLSCSCVWIIYLCLLTLSDSLFVTYGYMWCSPKWAASTLLL